MRWLRLLAPLALVIPLTAQAAPTRRAPPKTDEELPVPPIPPGTPLPYTAAPVPDLDIFRPEAQQQPQGTQLAPSLWQPRTQWRGEGFTPGSTVQGEQERNFRPVPGFRLKMPLQ